MWLNTHASFTTKTTKLKACRKLPEAPHFHTPSEVRVADRYLHEAHCKALLQIEACFFPMQFTSLRSIYPFWYWHGHMPSCLLCLDSMKEPPHLTYDQILQDACSAPTRTARKLNRKVRWVKVVHGSMFDFSQMVNRLAGAEASS